jgi:hypothetical protein
VLAYLFWHSPADSADIAEYEALLLAFHARLREAPPPGFRESAAFAVTTPWSGDGYEDWYLVDDWSALGVLNADAVDDVRGPEHDPIARLAARGAGGVYEQRAGDLPIGAAGAAQWSAKPLGKPYGDFEAGLTEGLDPAAFALWQRQLVLGPAPEFCLLEPGDALRRVT